jgi:hypothetical protein
MIISIFSCRDIDKYSLYQVKQEEFEDTKRNQNPEITHSFQPHWLCNG